MPQENQVHWGFSYYKNDYRKYKKDEKIEFLNHPEFYNGKHLLVVNGYISFQGVSWVEVHVPTSFTPQIPTGGPQENPPNYGWVCANSGGDRTADVHSGWEGEEKPKKERP